MPRNAVTNALVTRLSQTPVTAPRPDPSRPVHICNSPLLAPHQRATHRAEGRSMTKPTEPPIPCCCDLHGRDCCRTHGDQDMSPELFPDPRTTTEPTF